MRVSLKLKFFGCFNLPSVWFCFAVAEFRNDTGNSVFTVIYTIRLSVLQIFCFILFESWFDRPIIRSCSIHYSILFDPLFDPVRLMIRPCSTLSTMFDSWFDPARLYWPCSTHDSTLFDPWFDIVLLMIRPCSTQGLTLFDSWFDPVWLIIRSCSTLSFLFDSRFNPVRPMIRLCSNRVFVRASYFAMKIGPCRPNHESNNIAREFLQS